MMTATTTTDALITFAYVAAGAVWAVRRTFLDTRTLLALERNT